MLREVGHFIYHAPSTISLMRRSTQAELYDTLIDRAEAAGLGARRSNLVADLEGEVLEIGCGTGAMFRHYSDKAVVTAVEPEEEFLELARPRAEQVPARVTVESADAMNLPYDAGRFDAVVFGLVLCSVPDVDQVLSEAKRVLSPKGRLRLIEHVRSHRPVAAALMNAFNPIWLKLNGQGCNMNRDPVAHIERAGFQVEQSLPFQFFAPGMPAFPMRLIRACS